MTIANAETHGLAQADFDTLERMIDKNRLSSVLECIADICGAKAAHLISNWQDRSQAALWNRAMGRVRRCAENINPC